jgi:hypothetical protein
VDGICNEFANFNCPGLKPWAIENKVSFTTYNQINTFHGIAYNIPNYTKIGNDLFASTFEYKSTIPEIFSLSSGYTWTNLGNLNSAYDYHTVNKLVYIELSSQ